MDLNSQPRQGSLIRQSIQKSTTLAVPHSPVRCNFKRVFSTERSDLQTTLATEDAAKTLPSLSAKEQDLLPSEWSSKRARGDDQRQQDDERFSVQFKKVSMTPSALLEQKILEKCKWDEPFTQCAIFFGGKTIDAGCKVTAGELQFSNHCSFRLSKISKIKVAYEEYQKCLWLTYEDNTKNKTQENKLRLHIVHDVKDDLYLLFARIVLQKMALIGHQADLHQEDDPMEDRFRMQGTLLKKSQFLGKWAERKVVLGMDRIESFKSGKCTFAMRNIRELWTRFDTHQGNIIVKVRHGAEKTEMAIPLTNYTARFCKGNWLYRIYRIVTAAIA